MKSRRFRPSNSDYDHENRSNSYEEDEQLFGNRLMSTKNKDGAPILNQVEDIAIVEEARILPIQNAGSFSLKSLSNKNSDIQTTPRKDARLVRSPIIAKQSKNLTDKRSNKTSRNASRNEKSLVGSSTTGDRRLASTTNEVSRSNLTKDKVEKTSLPHFKSLYIFGDM